MKRLENLSTLNITTMNNDKNQTSNSTNEKVTRVSSMEEMIAILDGEAIKISENGETKFFYLKENEKVEIAHQIAEMYLQQFPRPKCYGVHLLSSEGGNELTPYYQLTDEEIAGLQVFAKKVAIAIKKAIPCVKVGQCVLGLEVPHAHIHLVPMQSEADIRFTNPHLKLTPEEFQEIAEKIKREL